MFLKILAGAALAFIALGANASAYPQRWSFSTVDNPDCSSTYLTGINNREKVVGYCVAPGKVNAFTSEAPYARYDSICYPGAVACQALALSNTFAQAGVYVAADGQTYGYLRVHSVYTSYAYPITGLGRILCGGQNHCNKKSIPPGDLLAVGSQGATGFQLDTVTNRTTDLPYPAAAINGKGDVAGNGLSGRIWWLKYQSLYDRPYSCLPSMTAYGMDWEADIVGGYVDGAGAQHGFVLSDPHAENPTCLSVDATYTDAGGTDVAKSTTIAAINDKGEMVGWYVDANGLTHGFLAVPQQ